MEIIPLSEQMLNGRQLADFGFRVDSEIFE